MPIAFKEWAVTVRALAEGEQLVTLRKGGIREPDKHFALEHDRFFLYPTFDHQRSDLVRESHQPELRRALEEGVWAEGEPMLAHDFAPLFKLDHMLKDVLLCLEDARAAGAAFPFAGLAGELYSAGAGRGLGDQDFAAVLEVVEDLNNTRL